MLFGVIIAWLTMVAPITVLSSWLWERPTMLWTLISLPLAPLAAFGLWRAIQSRNPRIRWPVMQYFGWGAVLLPLIVLGALLTLWLPERTVGLTVLATWLVLGTAGVFAATRIGERHLTFDHHRLDRPYKLVQLSDVHVGSRSADFLGRAISQALRHQPDALLITGDLVDASALSAEDLGALADLPCPAYLSLGNHERYIDYEVAIAMIETHGVDILRSRSTTLGRLQIIGIDDADHPDHVEGELPAIVLSDSHYRILLYHRPDGWAAARTAGIDLMLAGHTHGGQIWPFNYLVRSRFKHLVGLFSEDDRHLYVSPGTGCWGPVMRLGTRAEMTVIDLLPTSVASG
ncbi:MAG: metallophosphoesterase [Alphaproteobacteria bacterium]|nr:metallophosphoesterase [Alphaproteobacteria bacterium]